MDTRIEIDEQVRAAALVRVGGAPPTAADPAGLDDPYVYIQSIIPEKPGQEFGYLTISESVDPGRDLDDLTPEEITAGVVPDMTRIGKTKVVHISGVTLVWDSTVPASAAIMAYNKGTDIAELNLYADTVIVREPIVVPGGDVRIWARRLEFQGRGRIVTDAEFVPQKPVSIGPAGARGARGGTVSLMVKTTGAADAETWPSSMAARYACGVYIEREQLTPEGPPPPAGKAENLTLISTKGGMGQEGGPGGTTQAPRAFGPAESRGRDWFMKRMADTPIWRPNGAAYESDGHTVRVGTAIGVANWGSSVPAMGGGDILRVIVRPGFSDDRSFLPVDDWQSDPKNWPPRNGADATPAGKPGLGGKGGDLVSTVKSAMKKEGGIELDKCVDLAGGKSGKAGEVANGGNPDSPNPYKVQTVNVVFVDQIEWLFGYFFHIDHIQNSFETFTLSKGKDAAPRQPDRESGDRGTVRAASQPDGWLHPFQLRAVVQYAKDLFLSGHREKALALLSAYRPALARADDPKTRPPALEPLQDEVHGLAAEVDILLHRLENSRDFFGNPVGWTPVLSLKSNVQLYKNEIDNAIRELWFAYRVRRAFARVQDATKELQAATAGLDASRTGIEEALKSAQNAVPGLLVALQNKQSAAATKQAELKGRVADLKAQAGRTEQSKRIIDGIFGVIDAVCTALPVGQPYVKAAGSALANVEGFFTSDPQDRWKALNGLGESAKTLKDDLDKSRPELLENVTKQIADADEEAKSFDASAQQQQTAYAQVEEKTSKFREVRQAKEQVSSKELEIVGIEAEIRGKERLREAWRRKRPPEREPGVDDPDASVRQLADKRIAQLTAEIDQKNNDLAGKKKELQALKTTLGDKTADLGRLEDRHEWSVGVQAAKTAIAQKQRDLEAARKKQSTKIDKAQRMLGGASEGLGKLASTVKTLTLPEDEIQKRVTTELEKLETNDPAYQQLKAAADELEVVVTGLKASLDATKAQVDLATRSWLDNRRQKRVLDQAIRTKARVLDHLASQYVDKMKADACERLIRFQYYIQKSYEYYFLAPCPFVDYSLVEMSDRILDLLETSSGTDLRKEDFEELKTLFRKPIVDIADEIVKQMQTRAARRVAGIPVRLADQLLAPLNAGRTVRCTPVGAFDLELSCTDQRLAEIALTKAVLGDGRGRPEALRVYLRHAGTSIVRGKDALYCFAAGLPGGRAQWGFTWEVATQKATSDPKETDGQDLLKMIVGDKPDYVADLSEYHPGIFSDFEIWVGWSPAAERRPIKELHFEVKMPYDQPDDRYQLLHVKTSGGLQPRIDCGYVGDAGSKRLGGDGDFFRLLRQNTTCFVRAPATYGSHAFQKWESSIADDQTKLKNAEYVFTVDRERALRAVYS
jgi:hypothetical protein